MSQGMESESGTADLTRGDDRRRSSGSALERLDPDNRPEDTEVDNTGRTFDSGAGKFTDSDDYDESDRPFVTEEGVAPP